MPDPGDRGLSEEAGRLYEVFLRRFGLEQAACPACVRALLPAPFNLESYSYTARGGPTWTWDVTFARALVALRRPPGRPEQLEPGELNGWLEHHGQIDRRHLAHIPADRLDEPVLLAPAPDGQGQVLIDGSHRAATGVRAGRPVLAYLLTDDESALAIAMAPLTMHAVQRALRAQGFLPPG